MQEYLDTCDEFSIYLFHARQEHWKYDQRFTRSRHKAANGPCSAAYQNRLLTTTPSPRNFDKGIDRVTLVQIQCASSILKAFLVQRFRLEGECRNRSQIDRRLMILISNFANPQSLPKIRTSSMFLPAVDLQSTPASTISSCGCLVQVTSFRRG